ncbi:hypothetical protein ABIE45_003536 [Methylobacterium sp. OAE515]|jgi:hypothetical protein|uniref:hypothetical protein n=1 Tax=Methylobacterium sp. OAE515 TaxID=2817895 RepID=UPI00178A7AC2
MSKPLPERPGETAPSSAVATLTAGVRRHLGQNLRTLYADTLAAPANQRLEDLVAQLSKPKR